MATIHPSRLGLVPQDPPKSDHSRNRQRGRSPSPRDTRRNGRSTSRSPGRNRGDYHRGDRERKHKNENDGQDDGRDDDRRRHRARADDYFGGERRDEKGRPRSRSVDKQRDKERTERERTRRPSPEYAEYRRASPPREGNANAPWRQQENMYPGRQDRMPQNAYGGGADFLERCVSHYNFLRSIESHGRPVDVYKEKPARSAYGRRLPKLLRECKCSRCLNQRTYFDLIDRSISPDGRRHKKSKKRRRDYSDSDTDSEDERRRRERKEKRKARKERERGKDRHRHRTRSRSARQHSDDEDERDRHERRRRERTRSRTVSEERRRSRSKSHKSATRTKSPEEHPPQSEEEDEWVEKPVAAPLLAISNQSKGSMAPPPVPAKATSGSVHDGEPAVPMDEDSDDEVGPKPLTQVTTSKKRNDERQYGGALLRGEGSAMAAFLQDGTDVRIPRRGEIGLTSDEIADFESVGYVMSGSRHKRMNAVRMRKENQVISAEEKRGILKLQREERERKEAILREEFQELVQDKLKSQGAPV